MSETRDITAADARAAAEMEANVGAENADVYAKGLLAATQAGQTAAAIEEFDAVMTEMIGQFPELEAVLDSILVLPEEKEADRPNARRPRVAPYRSTS